MSQLDGAGTPENLALPLKVYWQPGCSSCLKTKEFLLDNGIPFVSVNVLEDEEGFKDLQALGVRLIPIAALGTVWANGAVFRDVAQVAGFEYGEHTMLTPDQPISDADLQGLPLPKNVWDNERSFEEASYTDIAETQETTKTSSTPR